MVRISFLIPSIEIAEIVENTFNEHNEIMGHTRSIDQYTLKIHIAPTINDVLDEMLDSDIIIARGLLADKIEEQHPNLVVVRIPISGSEIIRAIFSGLNKKEGDHTKIGVLGAYNIQYSASGLDKLLNIELAQYQQHTNKPEDIQADLDMMVSDNCNVIICGYNTFHYAKEHALNYNCNIVAMSKESFFQAITEAKHVAKIRRQEYESAIQHKAILDSTTEGILVLNSNEEIISLNKVAGDILGINEKTKGKKLSQVFRFSKFARIAKGTIECEHEIVQVNEKSVVLTKTNLHLRNDFIGSVLSFQKTDTIQREEIRIRNKMYLKGNEAFYKFDDILGDSPQIREIIKTAKQYSSVNSNILITGETGTGKEIFAQSIHNNSARKSGAFVAINCAALSPSLLESELFGYTDGAFTGAVKGGKQGLFELAHSGTCFLDEISELPQEMQGRLLRVIQERQVRRLGDDRVIPIDIRIICATNKPLFNEVKNGKFRRDLFYRLNVLKITIPPLRERRNDIPIFMENFINQFCIQFHSEKKHLSTAAKEYIKNLYWDGNVRELKNFCECLTVTTESTQIQEHHIAALLDQTYMKAPQISQGNGKHQSTKTIIEKQLIEEALSASDSRAAAAHYLGISTTTLWRKMKKLNIEI